MAKKRNRRASRPRGQVPTARGLERIREERFTTSLHALSVIEDPDSLEAAAAYWIDQVEAAKWPRVIEWFQNYAFLRGNPFPRFTWAGTTMRIDPMTLPDVPAEMVTPRTVENLMIEPYQVNVSMFNEAKPRPQVTPNSDQSDDVDAAAIAETALDVLWERPLNMPSKHRQVGSNLFFCGTAAVEIDVGDAGVYESQKGRNGRAKAVPQHRARVWNAFELLPDPGARDDDESLTWIGRSSFEDRDWVREMFSRPAPDDPGTYYPERLEQMGTGESHRSPLYWWERVRDVLDNPDHTIGHDGLTQTVGQTLAPNQVILRVIDVRPNPLFPSGRTLIFAGGKLAYQGPARAWSEDYPERWHPYSIYRYWRVAGCFWAIAPASALVPLQRRANAIDALIQLNREHMTIGQWLLPSAARVNEGDVSGVPGRPIRYKSNAAGAKPERVEHEPLPAELLRERELVVFAIRTLGGVTRFNQNDVAPSAARAGIMLEALERTSKAAKSAMLQDFEESTERTGENILIETSLKLRENDPVLTGRIRAAARGKSQLAIRSFTGLSLRQNVHVRLDIRSELMKSPEFEREAAIQWVQFAGADNMSPEERAYFIRKAGFRDFERTVSPHVDRCNRLLDRLTDGTLAKFLQQPEALMLPVDEFGIFADVIRSRMLEDRFQDTPQEVKAAIFRLWDAYRTQAAAQQQAQQEAALRQQIIMAMLEKGNVDQVLALLGEGGGKKRGAEAPEEESGGRDRRAA